MRICDRQCACLVAGDAEGAAAGVSVKCFVSVDVCENVGLCANEHSNRLHGPGCVMQVTILSN